LSESDVDDATAVKRLADRAAIYDNLVCYAKGLDRLALDPNDSEMVASAFTEDVYAEYGGGEVVIQGRPQLLEMLRNVTNYVLCHHIMGNMTFDFRNDEAVDTEAYVVAYMLQDLGGKRGYHMLIRGARWIDRVVKRDGRWAISKRHHTVDWMFETGDVTLYPTVADLPYWQETLEKLERTQS
jgi:hypothetical protein